MKSWTLTAGVLLVLGFGSDARTHQPSIPSRVPSCDASDLSEIVGYSAIVSTNVSGEFEGADFDKPVKLDNGMIFEFTEYNYTYSYRPDVIIFARSTTFQGRSMTLYKLLIEDELYDVTRVR